MGVSPGHANLRKAKQKSRKISKEKALVYKAMPFAAESFGFLKSQADRSKTAWEEYEAGIRSLDVDAPDKEEVPTGWKQFWQSVIPGGKKGYWSRFEMPEGTVELGKKGKFLKDYDREKIRKLGSFTTLSEGVTDEQIESYKKLIGLIDDI